jgi:hypothetical protein
MELDKLIVLVLTAISVVALVYVSRPGKCTG